MFIQTTWLLAAATAFAVVALIFDRDQAQCWLALDACLLTVMLSAVRLARCVWVLEQLVKIVAA